MKCRRGQSPEQAPSAATAESFVFVFKGMTPREEGTSLTKNFCRNWGLPTLQMFTGPTRRSTLASWAISRALSSCSRGQSRPRPPGEPASTSPGAGVWPTPTRSSRSSLSPCWQRGREITMLVHRCRFQCVCVLSRVLLFCNPAGRPPGSSVHGISQARILEWVAISFSWGSSRPRDGTGVSCTGRRVLYH